VGGLLIGHLVGPFAVAADPAPVETKPKPDAGKTAAPTAVLKSAGEPAVPVIPPEQIRKAIQDLGSDNYRVRQKAASFIWRAGKQAEEMLKNALAESTDFEVTAAGKPILERFEWGIYPDIPQDVMEIIDAFRFGGPQERMQVIMQLGATHKNTLAHDLIARETDARMRQTFEQQFEYASANGNSGGRSRYARAYNSEVNQDPFRAREIRKRIAGGDFEAADTIFSQLMAGTPDEASMRDYAAFLLVRGKLDAKVKELKGRPISTSANDTMLIWMMRAQGDYKGAIEIAKKRSLQRLVDELLAEMGDWKELAARDVPVSPVTIPSLAVGHDASPLTQISTKMARYRLAGETQKFDKAAKELIEACSANPQSRHFAALMLILNERADDGMKLWLEGDDIESIEIGCILERYGEVFKKLGVKQLDQAKPDWSELLKFEATDQNLARFMRVCQVAVEIGKVCGKEKGESLLAALEAKVAGHKERLSWYRRLLMTSAVEMESYALADQYAAELLAVGKAEAEDADQDPFPPDGTSVEARTLISSLFDKHESVAYTLLSVVRKGSDAKSMAKALQAVRKILGPEPVSLKGDKPNAEKPTGEKANADKTGGKEGSAPLADLSKEVEKLVGQWDHSARGPALLEWAKFLQERGMHEEALRITGVALPDLASVQEWIECGDIYMAEKRWADAKGVYERARRADTTNALALYLIGQADLKDPAQANRGRDYIQRALLLPLGDAGQRQLLADRMRLSGAKDEAMAQDKIIQAVARIGERTAAQSMWTLAVACQKKGDYATASRLWDRLSLRMSENIQFPRALVYAEVPRFVHLAHAKAALQSGKLADGLAEMHRAESLNLDGSELVLECAPDLKKLGAEEEVDKFYQRGRTRYEAILHDYPASALHHNNLAWLAAKLNRDLDMALEHAQKAVALRPEQAGYLDTLAEVQYNRGNRAEAISFEKRCMAMDPSEEVFGKQLARFEGK
jgi:tetratricopeptide (TPR) repeat protein